MPKGKSFFAFLGSFQNQTQRQNSKNGTKKHKSDPYAFYSAMRPAKDSIVYELEGYEWKDDYWMYTHPKIYDKPCCIMKCI